MYLLDLIFGGLNSAWLTLLDYLTFHVLLCLIPAFFIAGAMTAFIPTDLIMKYIGPNARARVAYPVAAIGGLLLAVCSCTVIPLFVGIYKKGAGLGPAITFLFSAPAVNILALVYTGTMIGMDIAIARAILALTFAMVIGVLMALSFEQNENSDEAIVAEHPLIDDNTKSLFTISELIIIGTIVISGIFLVVIQNIIVLLSLYAVGGLLLLFLSVKYKEPKIVLFLWLVFFLFVGTSQVKATANPIPVGNMELSVALINMGAKLGLIILLLVPFSIFLFTKFTEFERQDWFTETWIFIKSIFPIIILGVVIAGFIRYYIPQEVIIQLVGSNTILSNVIAVFFGVFMYFPTLMEVPIAKLFLDMGMARGPLLAYLLADPELSIQSILVTRKYLGDKKNLVYVFYVAILTTIAGLIFGIFSGEGFGIL